MAGPALILRELHRLLQHARDLRTELERGPRLLKMQQDRIAKQEDELKHFQEGLRKLKVAIHEKEVSLKTRNQQIEKHEGQQNTASSKKEYDALKSELARDRQECQRLEDEILETMSTVETQTAQLPQKEQELQKFKQSAAQIIDDIQSKRQTLTARLAEVRKELEETEAKLAPEVLSQYRRLVTARDADALSVVEGRTCKACHTSITNQNYNDLVQSQLFLCKSCGCMLYLAEQPASKPDDE